MKNNAKLLADVQNAIKFEPLLHAAEIGVTVKNCVVSLTGEFDSYIKKVEAENATKKVKGVKAIIEKIEVKFPNDRSKTDTEVVEEVLDALKNTWSLPLNTISVKVENG
ncbi:BON domain-containing protein [Flavobacteriaceae bacterium MAR_2010_188]|nr:BON domain-containing protein [Flavobacteriaceae bacterium MAR_2010_188]